MRFQQLPEVPALDLNLALGLDNVCWCEIATGKIAFCVVERDLTGGTTYTAYFCLGVYNNQAEKWEFTRWCQVLFSGVFTFGPSRKMYPSMSAIVSKDNTSQVNLILHVANQHHVVRMFDLPDGDVGFAAMFCIFPATTDQLTDQTGNRHHEQMKSAVNGIYMLITRSGNPRIITGRYTITAAGVVGDSSNLIDSSTAGYGAIRTVYNNAYTTNRYYNTRCLILNVGTTYAEWYEHYSIQTPTTAPARTGRNFTDFPALVNSGFPQYKYYGWNLQDDGCRMKLSYTKTGYAVCTTADFTNTPTIVNIEANIPGPVLHSMPLGNHRHVALINDDGVNPITTACSAAADFSLNQSERTSLLFSVYDWDTNTKRIRAWSEPVVIDSKNGYTKHIGCYWPLFRLANDKFALINPKWADPDKTGTDKLTLAIQTYQIQQV